MAAANCMVQRVAPVLISLQDGLTQLQLVAASKEKRSQGGMPARHGGEQWRLAVRVDGGEERVLVQLQRQDFLEEPHVAMDGGDVEAGVPLRSCSKEQAWILRSHVLH